MEEPRVVTCSCGYQSFIPAGWKKQFGQCGRCGKKIEVFPASPLSPYRPWLRSSKWVAIVIAVVGLASWGVAISVSRANDQALRLAQAEGERWLSVDSERVKYFDFMLSLCQEAFPNDSRKEITDAVFYYQKWWNHYFSDAPYTLDLAIAALSNHSADNMMTAMQAAKHSIERQIEGVRRRAIAPDIEICDSLRGVMQSYPEHFGKALRDDLENGYSIDALCSNESPLLLMATTQGRVDAVELLLSAGADPNLLSGRGTAAIHYVMGGNTLNDEIRLFRLLTESGGDVNTLGRNGETALYFAAVNEDRPLADFLLDKGGKIAGSKFYEVFSVLPDFALQVVRVDAFLEDTHEIYVKTWEPGSLCLLCYEESKRSNALCPKHEREWRVWPDGRIENLAGIADLYLKPYGSKYQIVAIRQRK